MAKYFVTGGAGFIGTALCLDLIAGGHAVTCYDNFLPQVHMPGFPTRRQLSAAGVHVIEGDVRDRLALETALRTCRPDVIFHLASETGTGQSYDQPVRYVDVNVTGTAILIEAVRRVAPDVERVILASTRAIYGEGACVDQDGNPATPVARTQTDVAAGDFRVKDATGAALQPVPTRADICVANPASIYASSKLMQEHLCQQGFWGTDVDVVSLRLQNVFGPGQSCKNPYTGVLSVFTDMIARGEAPQIYEDGRITRDFVFVEDVARAFVMAGAAPSVGAPVLDIGSGSATTIKHAAEHLMEIADADASRITVNGVCRPGDVQHAVADISRTRAVLDWEPKTSLYDGLCRLWQWRQHDKTAA